MEIFGMPVVESDDLPEGEIKLGYPEYDYFVTVKNLNTDGGVMDIWDGLIESIEVFDKQSTTETMGCEHDWRITLVSGWIASKRVCLRCGQIQIAKMDDRIYTADENMPDEWVNG